MADIPIGEATGATSEVRSASRLLFIDNIRWTMIVLVLSMHACDTYSPFGNWYYVDRQQAGLGTARPTARTAKCNLKLVFIDRLLLIAREFPRWTLS